jgi:hypothetical protein
MKKFKEFLENYDVYLDTPATMVTDIESGSAVPINAPETVTENPKPKKTKGYQQTEETPVDENKIN